MDSLTTHPSTALQAKAFTGPSSLSFPGGAGDLTPPASEPERPNQKGNQSNGADNGAGGPVETPATPAATPSGSAGVSGIVPTLQ